MPNEPCSIWKVRSSGRQVITSPVPVITSYSRQVSWKPPTRNDIDSIEPPDTAPPIVIVFSSGTTAGTRPSRSVAFTRSTKVTPDSATQIRRSGSIERISSRSRMSSFGSERRRSPAFGT